ncbi:Putative arf3-interacting protein [Septoria linicola]|uniref:Arf3-interacting protein n=1 Tax=Septoria linicola TaxID=215465 RepID=A0A9Q9EFS1_9PEZI|nr:putative arf3-interacting protein [Septoria linicola]USW47972.1 Putative arf3-interacting protein [Septoria linicola]
MATVGSQRQPSLASFPSASLDTNSLTVRHKHSRSSASHQSTSTGYHSSHSGAQLSAHPFLLRSPQKHVQRSARPVKSQYPADSTEKHVEYILVASFDIDRGSIMEQQYPAPVGGDEHMLAELMLPDQVDKRSQDWTTFFLHKDAGQEEEEHERRRRRRRRRRDATSHDDDQVDAGAEDGGESEEDDGDEIDNDDDSEDVNLDGPPLVYVLNLVNTKLDPSVPRGAIVKAMAICTRHSFLHIYKPLLLLALEQYFAHPQAETLATLYEAVNNMDLSLLPRLSFLEKYILQASDAKDMFLEKFEAIIAQRMASNKDHDATLSPLEPSGTNQLQSRTRYGLPRDTHEFESVVNYANVPVPVKIPTAVSPETVGDFSLVKLITTFSTPHAAQVVPFNPTHPHLTTSGPTTHPIIVLLNALLTQKRVIFLGDKLPSSDVAEAVLAACALASGGLLRGFTRHAFPYTDLTKIEDLLRVPGFIAGVTNPMFTHHAEWWDLMCDLGTGRMKISNRIEQAPLTEGVVFFHQNTHQPGTIASSGSGGGIASFMTAGASLSAGLGGNAAPNNSMSSDPTGDGAFMQSVLVAINERHGENAIRAKFRKWIVKFTRLASSFEETVYGASALHIHNPESPKTMFSGSDESPISPQDSKLDKMPPEVTGHGYVWPTALNKTNELAANSTRIEGWRNTRSYYNFVQDLAALYVHRPIKHLDLQHMHDKLAKLRLGHEQSANIYLAICTAARTEHEISQLLSVVVNGVWENKATASGIGQNSGLLHIGMGLFHNKVEVREEVAELLGRIKEHEAGRHFWQSLGRFVRIAWERVMTLRVERVGSTLDEGKE